MPAWSALVTVALVLEYYAFAGLVFLHRRRTGVWPPAMTGHPELERAIRVHLNTLEKLAVVLPMLWVGALSVDDRWAAGLGCAWGVTRLIYAVGYLRSARGRTLGAVLGDGLELGLCGLGGFGAITAVLAEVQPS